MLPEEEQEPLPPDEALEPVSDDEALETPGADDPVEEQEEDTNSGYPKEIEDAIIECSDIFHHEDEGLRNVMLAFWKKLDNYFQGIQRIFWDSRINDWGRIDFDKMDPTFYDKIVNIYRAHGETIISALSVKLPNVQFFPDDAEVADDINTARAAHKIADLVGKHNEGILLFMKAIFTLYNQGVVAAYIRNRASSEYGEVELPDYGDDIVVSTHTISCPICSGFIGQYEEKKPAKPIQAPTPAQPPMPMPGMPQPPLPGEAPGTGPGAGAGLPMAGAPPNTPPGAGLPVPQPPTGPPPGPAGLGAPPAPGQPTGSMQGNLPGAAPGPGAGAPPPAQPPQTSQMNPEPQIMPCPLCGAEIEPDDTQTEEIFPQIVGYTKTPKSRTIIDVFGPMFVHMPFYARKQEHMPYLRLRFEQHFASLKATYPRIKDKFKGNIDTGAYDRQIRVYADLGDAYATNLVTVTCQWLRPWAFEVLEDDELIAKLKKQFPKGCYAVLFGNNEIAEIRPESLDEHWQISHHPLSTYIHADPIGKPLAPIQEIENEINDLALDTFEHAIPETFADPDVLDFKKYQESEASPGMKYPAKASPGKSLGDSFYTDKPATMSDEIKEFKKDNTNAGQFVVGSYPSLFGGPATSGSKTASEYSESRAMAMQRLNITWTMLRHWWANVMSKAVPMYVNGMVDDERDVIKDGSTGFVNVWIRQAELTGKIGKVEPEANEEIPATFAQFKQVLMELITLNNDVVNQAIFNPTNTQAVARALGWSDFHIPGQFDRDKQYAEFQELLKSGPSPDGMPSIQPEEEDDNLVHIATCRSFLVSPTGMAYKTENPQGIENIRAHMRAHQAAMSVKQEAPGDTPAGEPEDSNIDSAVQ